MHYGSFNNIISVTGYNEWGGIYPSYRVPAVLFVCETLHLDRSDYHRLTVIIMEQLFFGKFSYAQM